MMVGNGTDGKKYVNLEYFSGKNFFSSGFKILGTFKNTYVDTKMERKG